MEYSDEELIDLYLKGDEESFKYLVERYSDSLFNFTVRLIGPLNAKDVVQDSFLKIWKNLKNFNPAKASFKTWIFTIARNTIFDFLKKKKTLSFSDLDDKDTEVIDNVKDLEVLPDEMVQRLQDQDFFNSILDTLSQNKKAVLTLYYQEDLTFSEISQILNKPLNTIKSYHYRAILDLRKKIAPDY